MAPALHFAKADATSLENDVQAMKEMKYNPELERMAVDWINAVVKPAVPIQV